MITSIFTPSTSRKSKGIKKRLQAQKRAAREKYKLAQEQAEAVRYKGRTETSKDYSTSDQSEEYTAKFFYDTTGEVTEDEDEDAASKTSSAATTDLYRLNKKRVYENIFEKIVYKRVKFELKLREFFCIAFSLQVPLVYLIHHVFLLNAWGAILVLILFSVMEVVVAIPVFMVYMFLGNYGRRCYIKFWDCVPLFKGMAYSIAMSGVIYELLNVALSSLALLYMSNMITGTVPWIKCNFPNAHPECVPTFGTHQPYTNDCCDEDDQMDIDCKDRILETCFKYGATDYYNSYMLQKGYVRIHPENMILWKWAIAAIIEWFIIFILLSLGLRKFRGFMIITHLILTLLILLPGCLVTLMVSSKFHVITQARTTFDKQHTDVLFWLQTGIHILNSEVPGDVVTFSSLSKPTENATVNTTLIYTLKVLFLTLLSVWLSVFVSFIQNHYNVKNTFCIRAGGDELIFAIIPDALSRWPLPQLWLLLYFLIIFLWGLFSTTYALSSFVEAILEEFPVLFKWRIILTGLFSVCACSMNIFFLRPNFINIFNYLTSHIFVYVKAAQLFLSLVAVFIYSLERFKNDYHFNYGIMLSQYFLHSLKIALIILGVLFTLMYTFAMKNLEKKDVYFIVGLISPIIIGMIVCTLRYFLQLRPTLLDPDPKWGPAALKRKVARARFDPAHELHFRSTLNICKHNCLLTSVALKKEMKHWQSKQIIYTQQLIDDHNDDEKKTV